MAIAAAVFFNPKAYHCFSLTGRFLAVVFLVCAYQFSYGQAPYLKKYTQEEGIPATIYKVFNDSDGMLWFCTFNGVTSFNGFDFKNYNRASGFPGNGAYTAAVDPKGRIWFITFQENLTYYENHTFHSFKTPHNVSWLSFDETGEMGVATTNGHLLLYRHDTLYRDVRLCTTKIGYSITVSKGQYLCHVPDMNTCFRVRDGKTEKVKFEGQQHAFLRLKKLKSGEVIGYSLDKFYKLSGDMMVPLLINGDNIIKGSVIDCHDDGKNLWIAADNGLFRCSNSLTPSCLEKVYDLGPVTSIVQDREKNYWVTTWDGVFTFRGGPNAGLFYPNQGAPARQITGYNEESVYVYYHDRTIKQVMLNDGVLDLRPKVKLDYGLRFFKRDFAGGIIIGTGDISYRFDGENLEELGYPNISRYSEGRDSSLYVFNVHDGLTKSKGNKEVYRTKFYDAQKTNILNTEIRYFVANEDTLWGTSEWGVLIYTRDTIFRPGAPIASVYVNDIKMDRSGRVWVATAGKGLYSIRGSRVGIVGKEQGLIAVNCHSLFIDDDNAVWVASDEGLYKVIQTANGIKTISFNHRSLLPSFRVKGVFKTGNLVYAITHLGVSVFDETAVLENKSRPKVFITAISINNQDTLPIQGLRLRYNQNNIRIGFTALDYSSYLRPSYYYCLKGEDSNWVSTAQSSIDFSHLEPGNYTFYVAAQNMDGRRSENIASIQFTITPPFWATWWFRSLAGLAALAVLVFIIRHYKGIERKERMLVETKLKALRLHMNPHFIFNTLNSLQASVLNDKPLEANANIAKFSQLMRWVMSYSDRNELSLAEELSFLIMYVELERIRFEKEFNIVVDIDPQIDTEATIIPALVIQPFVENAIRHGLSGKKGKCELRITLTRRDEFIHVAIQDNGIGRESVKAEQAKSPITRKSTGIAYTEERLKTIVGKRKAKNLVFITDLYENGFPAGTKVELLLPILH